MRLGRPAGHATAALAALVITVGAATLPSSVPTRPSPAPAAVIDPALALDATDVPVVVQARAGRTARVAAVATGAGARVGTPLPLIDGFAATVSGPAVAALAASPDVVGVTLDRAGAFQSVDARTRPTTGSPYTEVTTASTAWERGLRGAGVTVAVLDTGISPMPDLADGTIHGPDLSGEGSPIDTYGHGTVMAGIIGGDGRDSAGRRAGIAPDARLVAVKVAGRNGAVDVSTVLQGLAWVAAAREQLGIRVLNLSYGTPSTQHPSIDPLNFAVQQLWKAGIVVVVAAGNAGPGPGTITKPGDDPVVLTVGAYDDGGDSVPGNDTVPAWSSRGPTAQGVAKPDLVAPGRTLIATRSHGSTVEQENEGSLVAPSYVKGSGTSEATAVTSGLVALLLQAHPTWTPDQVKRALTSTARPLHGPPGATGRGRPHLLSAIDADPGPARQQRLTARGLGSLEASRGGAHVTSDCGVIVGEQDVRCQPWNAASWTGGAWTGGAWTGGAWTGSAWTGGAWTGGAWTGGAWTGGAWTGGAWTGGAWTGGAWTGGAWTGYKGSDTLTAFWGDRPGPGRRVAGEAPAGEPQHGPSPAR